MEHFKQITFNEHENILRILYSPTDQNQKLMVNQDEIFPDPERHRSLRVDFIGYKSSLNFTLLFPYINHLSTRTH